MLKFSSQNSKSSLSLANAAAGAGIVAFGVWQYYRQKQKAVAEDEKIEAKYSQQLPFLPHEIPFTRSRFAATTWFEGDVHQASKFLRERFREILVLNPWLTAEIAAYKGKKCLVFNSEDEMDLAQEAEQLITIVKDKNHNLNVDSTRKEVGTYYYKHLRDRKRIWHLYVVPAADNPNHFCLINDFEHVAGDGYSRWRIFRMMLAANAPIVAMNPIRQPGFEAMVPELVGAGQIRLLNSLATLHHSLLYKFLHLPQSYKYQDFLLDTDEIKKIKSTINPEKDGVPYVTTNDVVASWILQDTSCRYLRMPVNMRGLSPKIDKDLSGNYVFMLFVTSDNGMATPANIRKQIKSLGLPDSELPHPFATYIGGKHCIMNNWASGYGLDRLAPPGCVELKHFLLLDPTTTPPSAGFFSIGRYKEGVLCLNVMRGVGMKPVPCPPFAKPISM